LKTLLVKFFTIFLRFVDFCATIAHYNFLSWLFGVVIVWTKWIIWNNLLMSELLLLIIPIGFAFAWVFGIIAHKKNWKIADIF
jgi:hypothetical protein